MSYHYRDTSSSCAPKDYWGQVKRTVGGKPVDPAQIDLIVAAVVAGLELQPDDTLLDLCCGNGALSNLIFGHCRGGLGVDFSETLIDVAVRDFQRPPAQCYERWNVLDYVAQEAHPQRFTKALCYGAFSYLDDDQCRFVLRELRGRFPNIARLLIGNLPDRDKMHDFFHEGVYVPGIEDDPKSAIGIWRSETQFAELASSSGWRATFSRMPPQFYAAKYRFDAILMPSAP